VHLIARDKKLGQVKVMDLFEDWSFQVGPKVSLNGSVEAIPILPMACEGIVSSISQ
jgi:hypothetical protein